MLWWVWATMKAHYHLTECTCPCKTWWNAPRANRRGASVVEVWHASLFLEQSTPLCWILAPPDGPTSPLFARRQWLGVGYANVALLHLNRHCCALGLWGRALSDLIQSGWLNRWLTWWREEVLRTDFKSRRASTHTKGLFSAFLMTSTCITELKPTTAF